MCQLCSQIDREPYTAAPGEECEDMGLLNYTHPQLVTVLKIRVVPSCWVTCTWLSSVGEHLELLLTSDMRQPPLVSLSGAKDVHVREGSWSRETVK